MSHVIIVQLLLDEYRCIIGVGRVDDKFILTKDSKVLRKQKHFSSMD